MPSPGRSTGIPAPPAGVLASSPLVHAQTPSPPPAGPGAGTTESGPSTTDGENEPWNRGVTPEVRDAARAVFLEGAASAVAAGAR